MRTTFACPNCSRIARVELAGSIQWQCPQCEHLLQLSKKDDALPLCPVCGNRELYRKKNFPHALGMGILLLAFIASSIAYALYFPWLTWAILIGSAAVDGFLYLWVGDAIVCYHCNAHVCGVSAGPEHKPFELGIAERYRQERLRRELFEKSRRVAGS